MIIGKDSEEIKLLRERLNNILDRVDTIYWIKSEKYKNESDILKYIRYKILFTMNIDHTIENIINMTKPKEMYDICIKSLDEIIVDAMQDRRREILLKGR